MSDSEWQWWKLTNPQAMLDLVKDPSTTRISNRKFRLCACAVVRNIWQYITWEWARYIVEMAERAADGLVSEEDLAAQRGNLNHSWGKSHAVDAAISTCDANAWSAAHYACQSIATRFNDEAKERAQTTQSAILRDIIGNPFQSVSLRVECGQCQGIGQWKPDWAIEPEQECPLCHGSGKTRPRWLTPIVETMALQAYNERDWAILPILADALEDAGLDNTEVLDHLRGPGPHARGCWGLDCVLGRE